MPDPFAAAEGYDALDAWKQDTAKRRGDAAPKQDWKQTNVRLEPELKAWARQWGNELGAVPLEDVLYLALLRLREDVEAGRVAPDVKPRATRSTLVG